MINPKKSKLWCYQEAWVGILLKLLSCDFLQLDPIEDKAHLVGTYRDKSLWWGLKNEPNKEKNVSCKNRKAAQLGVCGMMN